MEKHVCEAFAERLKYLRCMYGLTQEKLGKELGVTRGAIGYYENLERTPKITTVIEAARFFNASTDFLLGLTNEYVCRRRVNGQSRNLG
jgi:DNA-binding XRE family transcriptional regulator